MGAPLCPTLFSPMDCSPPGSSVYGLSQARILEWFAFPSPGDLPNPGFGSLVSPALQANSLPLGHLRSPETPEKCLVMSSIVSSDEKKVLITMFKISCFPSWLMLFVCACVCA